METTPFVEDTLHDASELTLAENPVNDVVKEVTITRSPLIFSRIYVNSYQKKGTKTMEVKQKLFTTAVYSGIKISNKMNDSMYDAEEFAGATQPRKFDSVETRVAWILIPVNESEADSMIRFKKYEQTGIIFKILSNSPILDEDQLKAIDRGLKTYDEFADKQAVRFGANDPDGNAGKLILDKQKNAQYKRTGFSRGPRADEDFRDGKSNVYQTPMIKAEMEGASALLGQTV
jgi:hypothetical protein